MRFSPSSRGSVHAKAAVLAGVMLILLGVVGYTYVLPIFKSGQDVRLNAHQTPSSIPNSQATPTKEVGNDNPSSRPVTDAKILALEKTALESKVPEERIKALKSLQGGNTSTFIKVVEAGKNDPGREWDVNIALKELVVAARPNQPSPVFKWISSKDNQLCSKLVAVASRLQGEGPDTVLNALQKAFPADHMVHLRAKKALKSREN